MKRRGLDTLAFLAQSENVNARLQQECGRALRALRGIHPPLTDGGPSASVAGPSRSSFEWRDGGGTSSPSPSPSSSSSALPTRIEKEGQEHPSGGEAGGEDDAVRAAVQRIIQGLAAGDSSSLSSTDDGTPPHVQDFDVLAVLCQATYERVRIFISQR